MYDLDPTDVAALYNYCVTAPGILIGHTITSAPYKGTYFPARYIIRCHCEQGRLRWAIRISFAAYHSESNSSLFSRPRKNNMLRFKERGLLSVLSINGDNKVFSRDWIILKLYRDEWKM